MSSALDFSFPTPSPPPSSLAPVHWPGISPASTEVLLEVLKHNHEKWHTFYNEDRFHNHAPHRSLAIWAMGADGDVIRAGYEKDCKYEKPAIFPPETITKDNFNEHLGDDQFYRAYMDFFTDTLKHNGIGHTLEEYLFSPSANVGVKIGLSDEGQAPHMLARFFSGVLHPLIHTGNGLEFGLPGLIAEGLAQTAVTRPDASPLVPSSLFDSATYSTLANVAQSAGRALHDAFDNTIQTLDASFESLLLNHTAQPKQQSGSSTVGVDRLQDQLKSKDVHVLDILGWVSQDAQFGPVDHDSLYDGLEKDAETVLKFSKLWKLDVNKLALDKKYLDGKIEELAFLVSVMYGVGGWTGRGDSIFNADFFLMHLITSSAFIPSLCAYISPVSQARFLHTYFAVALGVYVFRGCPALDIVGFQNMKELQPTGPQPTPAEGTLPSPKSDKAVNPDPWLPIVQTSVVHPDEHVPKTQRALANWASAFGTRRFASKRPSPASGGTDEEASEGAGLGMGWGVQMREGEEPITLELAGAEYLDGTVFLRSAELTAERMGRVREGEPVGEWDFKGFPTRGNKGSETKAHL